MRRRIVGFHTDAEGDWVADLECGHTRHVRHCPPFFNRPWVVDPERRAAAIGTAMDCVKCDRGEPVPDALTGIADEHDRSAGSRSGPRAARPPKGALNADALRELRR